MSWSQPHVLSCEALQHIAASSGRGGSVREGRGTDDPFSRSTSEQRRALLTIYHTHTHSALYLSTITQNIHKVCAKTCEFRRRRPPPLSLALCYHRVSVVLHTPESAGNPVCVLGEKGNSKKPHVGHRHHPPARRVHQLDGGAVAGGRVRDDATGDATGDCYDARRDVAAGAPATAAASAVAGHAHDDDHDGGGRKHDAGGDRRWDARERALAAHGGGRRIREPDVGPRKGPSSPRRRPAARSPPPPPRMPPPVARAPPVVRRALGAATR